MRFFIIFLPFFCLFASNSDFSLYKKETFKSYKEIDEIIEEFKEWDKQLVLEEILKSKEKIEEINEFKKTLK